MKIMEDMKFTAVDNEGNVRECDVLMTFECSETHKSYMVYTDNTKDDEGHTCVYASIYSVVDGEVKLSGIETDKEWEMIEGVLNSITDSISDFNG